MAASMLRAAGLIIFRKNQGNFEYLLMQTSYGEHHWTPPKGHVDPGESDEETAFRETKEEAGLTVSQFNVLKDFRKVMNYEVRGKPKTVIYWLAELKDFNTKITLSEEHQDFKWLKLEEACKYAQYKDMQETLQDAEAYLKKSTVSS